jgi:dipeptidase E
MIYLTSNGITSIAIKTHFAKYAKGGKAAIVTTASVGYKEKDKHIPDIIKLLLEFDYTVDYFDFEFDEKMELLQYDLVYIIGGNPFYLMKQINKNEYKDILFRIHKSGAIIVGASAGSMVLTNSIRLVNILDSELNASVNLNNLKGLGLVSIELCPHYNRFKDRFSFFEEKVEDYKSKLDVEFYPLTDGQGIWVDGDDLLVLGGED